MDSVSTFLIILAKVVKTINQYQDGNEVDCTAADTIWDGGDQLSHPVTGGGESYVSWGHMQVQI